MCALLVEFIEKYLSIQEFRRFDPQLNKMWHGIREGKIGPVRLVRSTRTDNMRNTCFHQVHVKFCIISKI